MLTEVPSMQGARDRVVQVVTEGVTGLFRLGRMVGLKGLLATGAIAQLSACEPPPLSGGSDLIVPLDDGVSDQDDPPPPDSSSDSDSVPVSEDQDADGFSEPEDCDDLNATVYPQAPELCDGLDNDCAGVIDEGAYAQEEEAPYGAVQLFMDIDADGYGGAVPVWVCPDVPGYGEDSNDCDDGNPEVYPDAPEVCDGLDNNCNAKVDEGDGAGTGTPWCLDHDQDGFGNDDLTLVMMHCVQPPDGGNYPFLYPYVNDCSDCNDWNGATSPSGLEVCDEWFGEDEDCDGMVNEADVLDCPV